MKALPQPTSAAQVVLHFDSAWGRTCQGPAGEDAELWQEGYPQEPAAQASPSPRVPPEVERDSIHEPAWWVGLLLER